MYDLECVDGLSILNRNSGLESDGSHYASKILNCLKQNTLFLAALKRCYEYNNGYYFGQ